MATRVYLVRHGATPLTAENRFSGAIDGHLHRDRRRPIERIGRLRHLSPHADRDHRCAGGGIAPHGARTRAARTPTAGTVRGRRAGVGVYFARLASEGRTEMRKVMLER
jgi:hypothetical protein